MYAADRILIVLRLVLKNGELLRHHLRRDRLVNLRLESIKLAKSILG